MKKIIDMTRKELIQLIKDQNLEIKHSRYKTIGSLRRAIEVVLPYKGVNNPKNPNPKNTKLNERVVREAYESARRGPSRGHLRVGMSKPDLDERKASRRKKSRKVKGVVNRFKRTPKQPKTHYELVPLQGHSASFVNLMVQGRIEVKNFGTEEESLPITIHRPRRMRQHPNHRPGIR